MPDLTGLELGSYRLLRCIGNGGFADVYLGEHIHLGILAAIKILSESNPSQQDIAAFKNEARTIGTLQHANIVRLLDFNIAMNGNPYLVMNYIQGKDLRKQYPTNTVVPIAEILKILRQIIPALQHAHDNKIVHRDIKPENILVDSRETCYLTDFGIGVRAHTNTNSMTHQQVIGTWSYAAPEHIRGRAVPASDQYAIAIVVYEWLCGTPPFDGSQGGIIAEQLGVNPPSFADRGINNPAVEAVIIKALSKDPQDRFNSVAKFLEALEKAAEQNQQQQIPPTIPAPAVEKTKKVPTPNISDAERLRISRSNSNSMIFKGHKDEITCMAVSPDGKRLASSSKDRTVIIWDIATRKALLRYTKHLQQVNVLAWSPDGSLLATGADSIHIWDSTTGDVLIDYKKHHGNITDINWFIDAGKIVSTSILENTTFLESAEKEHSHTVATCIWNIHTGMTDIQRPHLFSISHTEQFRCIVSNVWCKKANYSGERHWYTLTNLEISSSLKSENDPVVKKFEVQTHSKFRKENGIFNVSWSPKENVLAYIRYHENSSQLYVSKCKVVTKDITKIRGFPFKLRIEVVGMRDVVELTTIYDQTFNRRGIGNMVAPPYLVDAQRAPFRSRTTGFLGIDVLFSGFVRGRPFFLGIGKGGGATLYVNSSLTLQT